jgi:hypothetical protein
VSGVKAQGKRVQEIQQAGLDGADLAGAVIPQDVVDRRQCPAVVSAGLTVTYIQPLAGVGVEKGEPLFRRSRILNPGRKPGGENKGTRRRESKLEKLAALNSRRVPRTLFRSSCGWLEQGFTSRLASSLSKSIQAVNSALETS